MLDELWILYHRTPWCLGYFVAWTGKFSAIELSWWLLTCSNPKVHPNRVSAPFLEREILFLRLLVDHDEIGGPLQMTIAICDGTLPWVATVLKVSSMVCFLGLPLS
jgi:hypothetical protein